MVFYVVSSSSMLSLCLQCQSAQVFFISTLSHFPENLPDRTTLFHDTSIELHCTVSTLSDPALLPQIVQCLRLSSRLAALCNPGGEHPVFLPELHKNCLPVQLNYTFLNHSHQPSSLPVGRLHFSKTLACIILQNYVDMPS